MKKVFKSIMFVAAAAMAFSACNKEVDTQVPGKTGEMKNIQFSAPVNDAATRATLTTEDESNFTAAWVVNDQMAIEALSTDASYEESGTATWNGTYFDTNLPANDTRGEWLYTGYHPAKENIAFGSARVQSGSNYNSHYDVMTGSVTYQNALLGQNAEGGHMVIPMERRTSMIYFHLTSDLNETLSSATLTVTGGNIAAESVDFNNGAIACSSESNAITITFEEGTAPSASNFRLWFNTLPVNATSLSISVTTTSGKTATLTNPNGANYEAGKLYKIVKNGLNWQNGLTKGEEWSYTFTSKVYAANGTQALNGKNWGLAGDGNYWAYDDAKGQQFGSSKAHYSSMTLSSNFGDSYGVETIIVNASGASDINASMSITVGGKEFKCDNSNSASLTSTATEYTFVSSDGNLASGDIVISFTQTSSKAIYVKKIVVNQDNRIDPVFDYATSSYTVYTGETLDTPVLSYVDGFDGASDITYSIGEDDDPNVATVDATSGAVTIGHIAGTVTVTASFPGNQNYKASSASYTITVNEVVTRGWIETELASISSNDVFVIVGVLSQHYALPHNNGTSGAPLVVPVTVSANVLTSAVSDDIKWKVTGNASNGYTFHPANNSETWLYCSTTATSSSNNNIRVGTGDRKVFVLNDDNQLLTNDTSTDRYLSIYNTQDWRGYIDADLAPEIKFYKLVDPRQDPGMSWSTGTATASIETGNVINFTAPTLTVGNATNITYNSTNPSVASINTLGTVTVLAVGTTKIQAIFAGDDDYRGATAEYVLTVTDNRETVATPTFTEPSGSVDAGTEVSINCTTSGATIYYTVNGTDPTTESAVYSSPITVNSSMTIKAFAVKSGYKDSAIASVEYTVSGGNAGDPITLFHETFGNNSNSAREWSDSYSIKSGVSSVYSSISSYTVVNAKQGKNTTGSTQSGLNQSTQGTDASITIGPLNVSTYNDLTLVYQWKAASVKGTYYTKLYYATSENGSYTEVNGTGDGSTSFVERSYSLPVNAQVSTLYLKIVWNTSNTQAIIDEVDLSGKAMN